MKRKWLYILAFLLLAVLLLYFFMPYSKYEPRQALFYPKGYTPLSEAREAAKDVMEFVFFEEVLSLVDLDGNSVDAGLMRERDFLVIYKGQYYIFEERFEKALSAAKETVSTHNRIYRLGEAVEWKTPYSTDSIVISQVSVNHSDDAWIYEIEVSAVSDPEKPKLWFFDHVETKNGLELDEFALDADGRITVALPEADEIAYIYLKAPHIRKDTAYTRKVMLP